MSRTGTRSASSAGSPAISVRASRRPAARLELLQPARARPYVLDDATVARIIRVHRDQAGDLTLFQNQADRWKTDPGLTDTQRAGTAAYETLIA